MLADFNVITHRDIGEKIKLAESVEIGFCRFGPKKQSDYRWKTYEADGR
jgi:hypothetical protein